MLKVDSNGSSKDTTQKGNATKQKGGWKSQTDPALVDTTDTSGTDGLITTDTTSSDAGSTNLQTVDYYPTTSPDYTPEELTWAGRLWRVNSIADTYPGFDYAIQRSAQWKRLRFEVRQSDPEMSTKPDKRRAELSGSIYGDPTRLEQGVSLWGAFSVNQHAWADPEGMKDTWGGVYGQIHMGSKVGGSPALAFRRHQSGRLRITTRGEYDDGGTTRYEGDLSFGQVHDFVYNIVLHPTNGSLKVWVDGRKLVDVSNVSLGHSAGDSYWNMGLYFPGGVTSPVVAEYANHVYPATNSLSARVSSSPAWPSD